jgi:hypothetical protein
MLRKYSTCCWFDYFTTKKDSDKGIYYCYACGNKCGLINETAIAALKKLPSHQTPKDWKVEVV